MRLISAPVLRRVARMRILRICDGASGDMNSERLATEVGRGRQAAGIAYEPLGRKRDVTCRDVAFQCDKRML